MSSRDADRRPDVEPVSIAMSSTASTFAGSAIATISVRSSTEADRDRLVALRGGGVDQVRGRHVDLEDGQVEVVEAVALADRARELVLA